MFPALPLRVVSLAEFSAVWHRCNVYLLATNASWSNSDYPLIPGADIIPSKPKVVGILER